MQLPHQRPSFGRARHASFGRRASWSGIPASGRLVGDSPRALLAGVEALIAAFGLRGVMGRSGAVLVLLVLALWGQVRQADAGVADGRPAGVPLPRRRTKLVRLPRPGLVHAARPLV